MDKIVEKYSIKVNNDGLYCLDDLVNNVIIFGNGERTPIMSQKLKLW